MSGRLSLDPELAYEIAIEALNVVGSVSPGVHKRIAKAHDAGTPTASPTVSPRDLVALRRALNKIEPGGLADQVIAQTAKRRAEKKASRS